MKLNVSGACYRFLFCAGMFVAASVAYAQTRDPEVIVGGDLMQWHEVRLDLAGPASSVMATPNPFLDYRFNVRFTGPDGQVFLVPGYFAGDGNGGDSGNVWRVHFNPNATGSWSYVTSFRQGAEIAVDLDPKAGTPVDVCDGMSGRFTIGTSNKSGNDFRAPQHGMLVNRGHRYLTYGGSGKPFLYTGPGIPENILGYRGFTNSTTGIGHLFQAHQSDWKPGDPNWNGDAGKGLVGALNFIANEGGNCLYLMSNTMGGDGKDVFMHPKPKGTKDRYDILKLDQWDLALGHAQSLGIFLHWHLAETEKGNKTYYGKEALPTLRKLYFRMLVARFGHYNGLKWNLMEETTWKDDERRAQMAYLKAIDCYNHPVTFQLGGAGLKISEFRKHLGESLMDSVSIQGGASDNSLWDIVDGFVEDSQSAGVPWTVAWDEPQTIENDINDQAKGYAYGRYAKMWPCIMAGGDGFMWYIQQDGGGHGFDQRIEDFSMMAPSFNWCRHLRDFMDGLPLLEMQATRNGLNEGIAAKAGSAYMLYKQGEVYALYRPAGTGELRLDLSKAKGRFTVSWFNPRNGTYAAGSVEEIKGGGVVGLGNPPEGGTNQDWAVLVQIPR